MEASDGLRLQMVYMAFAVLWMQRHLWKVSTLKCRQCSNRRLAWTLTRSSCFDTLGLLGRDLAGLCDFAKASLNPELCDDLKVRRLRARMYGLSPKAPWTNLTPSFHIGYYVPLTGQRATPLSIKPLLIRLSLR